MVEFVDLGVVVHLEVGVGEELEDGAPDLDDVAVAEDLPRCGNLVDEEAVGAGEVLNDKAFRRGEDAGVGTRDGAVIDDNLIDGDAADAGFCGGQRIAPPQFAARDDDEGAAVRGDALLASGEDDRSCLVSCTLGAHDASKTERIAA